MLWYGYGSRDAVYDMVAGQKYILEFPRFAREGVASLLGPVGPVLEMEYSVSEFPAPDPPPRFFSYQGEVRVELPISGRVAGLWSGPSIQFTRDGTRVAIGIEHLPQRTYSTAIVDLHTLETTEIPGYAITTHGAWSPNGDRLLVSAGWDSYSPLLIEIASDIPVDLAPLLEPYYPQHREDAWTVAGWLDDTRVMTSRVRKRRLDIGTLDVDSGDITEVVDVPARPHTTLEYAPWAAQDHPESIGRIGPAN